MKRSVILVVLVVFSFPATAEARTAKWTGKQQKSALLYGKRLYACEYRKRNGELFWMTSELYRICPSKLNY